MKEITREIINIDKFYYMETINSTAEGYFHSCSFPCAGYCVLRLQASSVATDMGTARCGTEDICYTSMKDTHVYINNRLKATYLNLLHT